MYLTQRIFCALVLTGTVILASTVITNATSDVATTAVGTDPATARTPMTDRARPDARITPDHSAKADNSSRSARYELSVLNLGAQWGDLRDAGACCHPDGTCTVESPETCLDPDIYLGSGTVCQPNCCPQTPTGGDCACDTHICMVSAECATGRVCSGSGAPCDDALDCPLGDTCDPNFNDPPESCTYAGPNQQSDCGEGEICAGHFTGRRCTSETVAEDCEEGETCELACEGPVYLDLQLPGEVQCIDRWNDAFYPPESCTFGPAGDAQCNASAGCVEPPCECAFVPADPVSYTWTGDSSKAFFSRRAGDQCNLDNNDLGWHEGFIFHNQSGDPANDCAIVTVDFCCNETIKTPV